MTHLRLSDFDVHADGSALLHVASGFACSCHDCAPSGNVRLTKSGKPRLVPVPPVLLDACRKHADTLRARFGARSWFFPVWRNRSAGGACRASFHLADDALLAEIGGVVARAEGEHEGGQLARWGAAWMAPGGGHPGNGHAIKNY